MTRKAHDLSRETLFNTSNPLETGVLEPENKSHRPHPPPQSKSSDNDAPIPNGEASAPVSEDSPGPVEIGQPCNENGSLLRDREGCSPRHESLPPTRPGPGGRGNSNAKVRPASGPKPKRKLSIDPFLGDAMSDDPLAGRLRSPRPGSHMDKAPTNLKTANATLPRPISQLTTAGFFDDVPLEKMPPPKSAETKNRMVFGESDSTKNSGSASPKAFSKSPRTVSDGSLSDYSLKTAEPEPESEYRSWLPQALTRLNPELIDFVCDVLEEDGSGERHMLEPQTVAQFHSKGPGRGKSLRRRRSQLPRKQRPHLRLEWKLFIEQSIFYVLSDPEVAIRSFTKKGSLYDSQTLWYCMLRLTRACPSLVLHSLWKAAASLFAPPKSLQSLRSPTTRVFPKHEHPLSNFEAGCLMSICLHALVAVAPLVSDQRQLYDMSRIRSHGLSLAGSGAVARQPASLCLQYDDAFSDDLALRLARRLFAAITARRYFDDLNDVNLDDHEEREPDVLAPLFSQLDFLNMDAVYILNFSVSDRALHETRVPTLLLDWARAVMLRDWDGSPEVPGDGPFGGALALIEAMCEFSSSISLRLPLTYFVLSLFFFHDRASPSRPH